MTVQEIIDGLEFTVDMLLFDPMTGETYTEPRNNMDKITIDACKGAIELLEKKRAKIVNTTYPHVFGKYGDMEKRMDELGHKAAKKRLCKCIVCNRPFQKDDDVYLAMMEKGHNKFVCGNCAARLG